MKISNLKISSYRQFKDFELDLTYPKGHPKQGLPLEKVCFIGQSGTGKTTLLKLLHSYSYDAFLFENDIDFQTLIDNTIIERCIDNLRVINRFSYKKKDPSEPEALCEMWDNQFLNNKKTSFDKGVEYFNENFDKIKTGLIYFPADLRYGIDDNKNNSVNITERKIIDFSTDNITSVWDLVLSKIQTYQEEELKIRQNISKVVEVTTDPKKIMKEVRILDKWRKNNFNPITDLADNCLNELLSHFSLRVKTDLDIQKKEDLGFVKIEDFNGNEIPNAFWSTGTKQIVLSVLPLYFLKPNKTIILFDEPERSLYPDMQKIIIDYYSSMATNSQFFYSTHSPIIASSFEPWEIVELKFDDKGYVYREKYYEGENSVDNYTIDPRYLNYDLILTKIFDLKSTNTEIRNEALTELLMLKNQLGQLKETGKLKTKEGKEVFERFQLLSKKLMWEE